MPRLFLNYYV
ncbi:hypothetical protein LINGRAHAP2_LOCUS8883 [Linum grandiflorum]